MTYAHNPSTRESEVKGLSHLESSLGYLSKFQGQNKTKTELNHDLGLINVFLDMLHNWALNATKKTLTWQQPSVTLILICSSKQHTFPGSRN